MEQKVRVRKLIRNDGIFPGKEMGETLTKKGDTGYVIGIGTYLQTYSIYAVHQDRKWLHCRLSQKGIRTC